MVGLSAVSLLLHCGQQTSGANGLQYRPGLINGFLPNRARPHILLNSKTKI